MSSLPPLRPAEHAESALVGQILEGRYPPDSVLPPERELATQLGVTRPTLREVLQRLDRDGWIQVRHGKSTRVRDVWREGGLNVLAVLVRHGGPLPPRFVTNLLEVRLAMAPGYARAAVQRNARAVAGALAPEARPQDDADAFATFDWQLHLALSTLSDNPVFTLILNGFSEFYVSMAQAYFSQPQARRASRSFYEALFAAAQHKKPAAAERATRHAMEKSLSLWAATERRMGVKP